MAGLVDLGGAVDLGAVSLGAAVEGSRRPHRPHLASPQAEGAGHCSHAGSVGTGRCGRGNSRRADLVRLRCCKRPVVGIGC